MPSRVQETVCVQALVLTYLAKNNGMDARIDSAYQLSISV